MNSRERVLTALDHREPDRVPIQVDFTPEAALKLSHHVRMKDSTVEAYSGRVSELPILFGHDLLVAWHGIATSYYRHEEREWREEVDKPVPCERDDVFLGQRLESIGCEL